MSFQRFIVAQADEAAASAASPSNTATMRLPLVSKLSMWTVILLIFSNIFMTIAWYGHLKFEQQPLWKVIVISWSIAFLEYCFQVPANRIGYGHFSVVQLKVIQEIITLTVFGVFATYYFGSHLRWNHAVAGGCLVAAAFFVFHKF